MDDVPRDIDPPERLERRVVDALRARGLVRPSRRRRAARAALAAAAGLLLFAGGFVAGASRPDAVRPAGSPRFLLLLHETAATASLGIPERVLVDEYGDWARRVSADGHAMRGEKLRAEPGQTLSGFFIVEAPSRDAAEAIAASSPHVRYGGRIDVREIEPTG